MNNYAGRYNRSEDEWNPINGRRGPLWDLRKRQLFVEGATCWLCGKPVVYGLRRNHPLGPSLDHLVALENGGHPTALENLAVAHYGCNSRKGKGRGQVIRPRTRDY
jgi:5-methylcytosine-specific restriction endonuclease McrA